MKGSPGDDLADVLLTIASLAFCAFVIWMQR